MNNIDIRLKINNREVTVPAGSTILEAAAKIKISIPTMCFLDGYERFTSCMVCVVHEIKSNRLVPSCSMPVEEGMEVETDNEKVREARKDALDFLLSEHVGDCEAPCQRACPANMDIPLMIRQIKEKKFEEAIRTIKRDIALPAVLGRICPAPCENACKRKFHDSPVSICYLKRFAADVDLLLDSPYEPGIKHKSGKKVAIAGAGPAGLSAAYYLLQEGHECFIFDSNPQPGGMLRYGVPQERLPEPVLDLEIQQIFKLGAHFLPGQSLGKDICLDELRTKYDAVVLAVGKIEAKIFEGSGIELSARGIRIYKRTFETALPGVFAGGNAVSEARMAVRALAHGKHIAFSVNQFLSKLPITGPPQRFNSRIGKLRDPEVLELSRDAATFPRLVPTQGVTGGYNESEAIDESCRCFSCDCRKPDSCKLRQYADEYQAGQERFKLKTRREFERIIQHDQVVYEPGKCIKCGLCVQITKKSGEKFGLAFVDRGFDARVDVPFKEPLSQGLTKSAAQCIEACPTGALSGFASGSQGGAFCKNCPPGPPAKTFDNGKVLGAGLMKMGVLLLLGFVLLFGCSGKSAVEEQDGVIKVVNWPIFRGDSQLSGTVNAGQMVLKTTSQFDFSRLKLLWTFQTGSEIISSPVIGSGYVYIGSTDGKVYAVLLKDGSKIWEFDAGDDIEASPLLVDKVLFIGSLSGDFFALNIDNGNVLWKFQTEGPIYGSANWAGIPASQEKLIFVGSHDNKMYCLDATSGKLKWTYETSHYINGTPAVNSKNIIFGGCDEKLHILSIQDGKKEGEVSVGSYIPGSPALVDNKAYVGHYGNQLACIDINNKKILWAYGNKKNGSAFFSSPAVGKKHVVIGSRDKYLHCVNRESGEKIWTFRTHDEVDSSPVIAGNRVIAGSSDGRLYVLNLITGEQVWSYEIGASIISCPAVVAGKIVIGAEDGRIYAFGDGEE